MAKQPKDETNGGDQLVLKLVPANSLKTWINKKLELKETKRALAEGMREHTDAVIKKGMNKDVGNLMLKLSEFTPEKLSIWKTHFDDCWEKMAFDAKIQAAANAAKAAAREGDDEQDGQDDDAPKRPRQRAAGKNGKGAKSGTKPSGASTGEVVTFPQAAE